MVEFKKLGLDDIGLINGFFQLSKTRTCDNTIGGTFMWRDFFDTEYAIYGGSMFFKVRYFGGRTAFSMPLGGDVRGALKGLHEYCAASGIPMVICTAAKADAELLAELYTTDAVREEAWSDYLYLASELADMPGRKFSGQRNHMNRFRRERQDYGFAELGAENLPQVREFFKSYSSQSSKDSEIFLEEERKVFEVLDNYEAYRQTGLVLNVAGKPEAFSIGEIIGDTLYVHIEKANTAIAGAYQMIVSEFVSRSLQKGVVYVNREEDVGDAGLRTSKLSYHPCAMVDKYTVTILN